MENIDMFSAATAPLTFHDFLDRMRQPAAADLARSIKSFIISFLARPPDPEKDSQSVQEFYSAMEGAFRAHPLWSGATKEELESAGEGLEKYLMTKLFPRAFAPLPEDAERDQKLYTKMSLLRQFLHPEHLDIAPNFQNESSWLLAQKELQKINTYKAPRDKLVCILDCCRVINNLLLNAMMAKNDNPPGADDFLPVLIYVIIKANPPQLQSNLLYIQRFRHQSRLVSEAAYFYTNLVSAASFIENLDAKSLSMDEREFEEKMKSAQAVIDGEAGLSAVGKSDITGKSPSSADTSHKSSHSDGAQHPLLMKLENTSLHQTDQPSSHSKVVHVNSESDHANFLLHLEKMVSVAKVEAGTSPALAPGFSRQLARKFPYLYARAGDLTVADVESLLNDYKHLVVKYVALHKSVEGSAPHKGEVLSGRKSKPTLFGEGTHITLSKHNDHGEFAVKSISEVETSHLDGASDIFHGLHVSLGTTESDKMNADFQTSGHGGAVSLGSIPSAVHPDPSEKVSDLEALEEDVKRELNREFSSDVPVPVHPDEQSQRPDSEFEDKLPQEAG
ncbi:hypothetical protein O6H91_18G011600 [Diphasiastrum complanatum]|uniref:Uncharacterized protein n=1 Tax=Diphasiastrum complanatum TaxID=34168 RepID=A0ACC2AY44_DIPCM|nr:hypothetical protein O6H91_18G011600 [Diphasiastrum complanatum]